MSTVLSVSVILFDDTKFPSISDVCDEYSEISIDCLSDTPQNTLYLTAELCMISSFYIYIYTYLSCVSYYFLHYY